MSGRGRSSKGQQGSVSPRPAEPGSLRRHPPEAVFRALPVDRTPRGQSSTYVPPPVRDVMWVPTEAAILRLMLEMARLKPEDVIYDMGCGDGRIVIEAAMRFGCRGVGIDIDPGRIAQCHEHAREAKVENLVTFKQANLFDVDVSEASVVMLYLLPGINVRLRPRLLSQLRPGSRIISNHFEMGDWRPDEQDNLGYRKVYRWIVPAWIDGQWKCVIGSDHDRRRMILNLQRNYQYASGSAIVDGGKVHLKQGRIDGDTLSFTLNRLVAQDAVMQFVARVEGKSLRGTCRVDGVPDSHQVWGGTRE